MIRPSGRFLLLTLALGVACSDSTRPVQESAAPADPQAPIATPVVAPEWIYLARADGSAAQPLTQGLLPAWSPDSKRLAFQRDGGLYVIDADGGHETWVARGSTPAWSPDGARIVFRSDDGISVMNIDGSNVRTLVRHGFRTDTYKPWDMGVSEPAWSPDGLLIAFEHLGDGDIQPAQAYVMNADGSDLQLVTDHSLGFRYAESDPAWSPSGSIALWSYGFQLAIVDTIGAVPRTILANFPSVAYGARPAWSPDGRTIAFNKRQPNGVTDIWAVSSTGGAAVLLVSGAHDPAWSPDGRRLAFVSSRAPSAASR